MLEYVAAANAAYSVVKRAIQNGKELHSCAKAISQFTHASDDLRKSHEQKKRSIWTKFLGKEDNDLETFMHLEAIKAKEDELKQMMIYLGRPGLHSDWVKYQVEARKRRQQEAEDKKRKIRELKENLEIAAAWVLGAIALTIVVAFVVWVLQRKGVI
tara:strand:- start:1843 stop:2313 length:471 start_codon:yes stop_codon:yes gene_type:complete